MTATISEKDKVFLRDLARQVAEIGHLPVQEEKAEMWRRHNDLERVRPMVLIFPEGSWREMLPRSDMVCEPGLAQDYEYDLRVRLYYWEHMQDDNVIEPIVQSPVIMHNTGWGIEGKTTRPEEACGAYHIDTAIQDESDVEKIRIPQVTVDRDATEQRFAMVQEIFDGILTVEKQGRANYSLAPLDQYASLRGIDRMYLDLAINPGMVHKAAGRIVDGHIAMIKSMEEQGALSLGNRRHYVGSGGVGYTRQLPQPDFDGTHVRSSDLWGFAAAQTFVEVSPAMHEEFALQHEIRALELFGLNCYGCCEPLHLKLGAVKKIPRLRRISISPWADVERSAEELGEDYIYSWKPNPAVVAGEGWDKDAVRRGIREFLEKTRGGIVEMIMKDTHTCRHSPQRMWDWVRIAKEEAVRF